MGASKDFFPDRKYLTGGANFNGAAQKNHDELGKKLGHDGRHQRPEKREHSLKS